MTELPKLSALQNYQARHLIVQDYATFTNAAAKANNAQALKESNVGKQDLKLKVAKEKTIEKGVIAEKGHITKQATVAEKVKIEIKSQSLEEQQEKYKSANEVKDISSARAVVEQQLSELMRATDISLPALWVVREVTEVLPLLSISLEAVCQSLSTQQQLAFTQVQVVNLSGQVLASYKVDKALEHEQLVATFRIILCQREQTKTLLGYNFSALVYNYFNEADLQLQQVNPILAQKQLHAHNLLHCLPALASGATAYLYFASAVLTAHSYAAYVYQTCVALASSPSQDKNQPQPVVESELEFSAGEQQAANPAYAQVLQTLSTQSTLQQKKQITILLGARGVGKTTLMLQYVQQLSAAKIPVYLTSLKKREVYAKTAALYLAPELAAQPDPSLEEGVLCIDEAAAFTQGLLSQIVQQEKFTQLVLATTLDGNESGANLGFWHKFIQQLEQLLPDVPVNVYWLTKQFRGQEQDSIQQAAQLLAGQTSIAELISFTLTYGLQNKQLSVYKVGQTCEPLVVAEFQANNVVVDSSKQQNRDLSLLGAHKQLVDYKRKLPVDYRIEKLTTFKQKQEFFALAYLTHYRAQVQDFATALDLEQELYGVYVDEQLIAGVHLIPEHLDQTYFSDLYPAVCQGTRLPPGNMALQTLVTHYGFKPQALEVGAMRISRIFVHPVYRNSGLAQELVAFVQQKYSYLAVMYSYAQGLARFWQDLGFKPLWLSRGLNKTTGQVNQLLFWTCDKENQICLEAYASLHNSIVQLYTELSNLRASSNLAQELLISNHNSSINNSSSNKPHLLNLADNYSSAQVQAYATYPCQTSADLEVILEQITSYYTSNSSAGLRLKALVVQISSLLMSNPAMAHNLTYLATLYATKQYPLKAFKADSVVIAQSCLNLFKSEYA
ncbi:AAA family ATPase [Psittacicella hinzii]|uniref:AAA+ ATPase domain-containing protein n=1 Tax=Psittacicella hinzii TaxID=2028575 RepID=A0A3A1YGA8_9GAMM|nr:AAA family ATPase [Psittacicella hinzii]RIY37172.1 hypothetical protein CKF58_05125 [Psittacicella hinzii]